MPTRCPGVLWVKKDFFFIWHLDVLYVHQKKLLSKQKMSRDSFRSIFHVARGILGLADRRPVLLTGQFIYIRLKIIQNDYLDRWRSARPLGALLQCAAKEKDEAFVDQRTANRKLDASSLMVWS